MAAQAASGGAPGADADQVADPGVDRGGECLGIRRRDDDRRLTGQHDGAGGIAHEHPDQPQAPAAVLGDDAERADQAPAPLVEMEQGAVGGRVLTLRVDPCGGDAAQGTMAAWPPRACTITARSPTLYATGANRKLA
jgi:hypothetical protein